MSWKKPKPPLYFCIDVEASGPLPPLYNLVSIGAVPVVAKQSAEYQLGDCWYRELKPVFPGFLPKAMAIHGITRQHLERQGMAPDRVLDELTNWVNELCGVEWSPVFVGHNAVFDWAYINYYYHHYRKANPFGYKAIDTKSLAMGVLGIDWEETHKERLVKEYRQLKMPPRKLIHRADIDAKFQAEILVALLQDNRKAQGEGAEK